MIVLSILLIVFLLFIFTPFTLYFFFINTASKINLEFGIVILKKEINIADKINFSKYIKKSKKKKKNIISSLKLLKNLQYEFFLNLNIPFKFNSNLHLNNMLTLFQTSKFFKSNTKKYNKIKITITFETFMIKGILILSIWNIIKAILKRR